MYKLLYTSNSQKDAKKIARSNLKNKCVKLLKILEHDPFQNPPPYEKLCGDLAGFYSRRINIQHRLVYEIDAKKKIVKILSMWTHYE
jgi:Txe/YoeB family toxin of toxin-antitoxin system